MEARRRASKRKNASLAPIGASPPIDPNVLFGAGPHNAWWQPLVHVQQQPQAEVQPENEWWQRTSPAVPRHMVSQPAVDNGLGFLLSQLIKPRSKASPPTERPIAKPDSILTGDENKTLSTRLRFEEKLQSTHSLDEIKALVRHLDLDLSQNPVYSELAFERILATTSKSADEFLLDPLLNPSAARNYSKIVENLQKPMLNRESCSENFKERRVRLLRVITKGFRMGLIAPDEAPYILRGLPGISDGSPAKHDDAPSRFLKLGDTVEIHKFYHSIFEALANCSILGVQDLSQDVLRMWITQIHQAPLDWRAVKLILILEDVLAATETRKTFSKDSMAYELFTTKAASKFMHNVVAKWLILLYQQSPRSNSDINRLIGFLSQLSTPILRSIVLDLPARLVVSIQNRSLEPAVLKFWESVLRQFDYKTSMKLVADDGLWRDSVGLRGAGSPKLQRFLLSWWTTLTLLRRTSTEASKDANLEARRSECFRQLQDLLRSGEDGNFPKQCSKILQALPLPSKYRLIYALEHATKADALRKSGFAALQDDKLYKHATQHMSDTLQELAESVNNDLRNFARIVMPLLTQDKLSLRLVTRVLEHNQELKLALANSWVTSMEKDKFDAENRSTSTSVASINDLALLLTGRNNASLGGQVLSFMHELAITFALSPALSDRQALRKVFWCFRFLHRYGAPIQQPVTIALWYAGVTRVEGRGTSERVVMWILRKIRETEGEYVAELLTRSQQFRRSRARRMWRWGRELGLLYRANPQGSDEPPATLVRKVRIKDPSSVEDGVGLRNAA